MTSDNSGGFDPRLPPYVRSSDDFWSAEYMRFSKLRVLAAGIAFRAMKELERLGWTALEPNRVRRRSAELLHLIEWMTCEEEDLIKLAYPDVSGDDVERYVLTCATVPEARQAVEYLRELRAGMKSYDSRRIPRPVAR